MDAVNASTPLDCNIDLYNTETTDKAVDTKEYLRIVGSLMYASLAVRPDISFVVTTLS
jgi:hypothetical protein